MQQKLSGKPTFVRQCFVGDRNKGVVEKHYKIKGEQNG